MTSSPKKDTASFAEVTVIDSQYNHFRDYVDIIRVYKCKLCPFCSPLEHVITSHMSKEHFPRRCFLCKQCLFVFESREQLIEHIEAGHGTQTLNCSFGEQTPLGSPTQTLRLSGVYQGDERTGKRSLDDGGVNGQSVTSSTSNLANIPDESAATSNQPNQNDGPLSSPGENEIVLRRPPSPQPVSQNSPPNYCTSSSQETKGRNTDKSNSGQLMGLGVRKMLQRRHSLGGSHPASELRMGFFGKAVKTEPVSPKESSTIPTREEVRPGNKDIASADSLTDSNERESTSRSSMVSCPDDLKTNESEIHIALPVQRDVAVVRGIPFRPEPTENVKNDKFQDGMEVETRERRGAASPCEEQQQQPRNDFTFNDTVSKLQTLPKAVSALELGTRADLVTNTKLDTRNDSKLYQRDKPPSSLRDIVSHVMEKHRHNNETARRPAPIPSPRSVDFSGQLPGVDYHGPIKTRPRSYSITEGEIPSFHNQQIDTLDNSKVGLRDEFHGHSTDLKQYGQTGRPPTGAMPLWYPYHQQPPERDQEKIPRMVPWPFPGHFPNVNPSLTSANVSTPKAPEESVLYRYLRNNPHMKRRRNSIGVMNPVEANRMSLPWPTQIPSNEMVARFGPVAQTHMPWGTIPGFMHGYGLGDKVHSPNSIAKHGSQVSPNRFGEYLADIERKEGNQSNNSDQTSSEGTQDLAQVDDITRQVNSAIRSTGGFYTEQNVDDGGNDYDVDDEESRSDDGRKRSRKSTFNIYREIPERKRKLDRVEEEKIKKSYNADGSFDYFTLTGWKAYKCELCKKRRFKTASELEDHKRLKHSGDLNQKSRKLVFHAVHVDENEFDEST
ncbi:uncharacterized protein [Antedon mediterranea]|uniref:uncharacterized protein n=1 Tax=Antedon mediterranea TaxID=105859 RepID=UPI003AF78C14